MCASNWAREQSSQRSASAISTIRIRTTVNSRWTSDMIFSDCPYEDCDAPLTVHYEAGGPGMGRWARISCEECRRPIAVKLLSYDCEIMTEPDFERRFPG